MPAKNRERTVWLTLGVLLGVAITYVWPHETIHAGTADRNEKFAMVTIESGAVFGAVESVFILDFLTGNLVGATFDAGAGKFTRFYARSVALDFNVKPRSRPEYAIVSGTVPFAANGKQDLANGMIYVAELTSGKVGAYGYPYSPSRNVLPPLGMIPIDYFGFREVAPPE